MLKEKTTGVPTIDKESMKFTGIIANKSTTACNPRTRPIPYIAPIIAEMMIPDLPSGAQDPMISVINKTL